MTDLVMGRDEHSIPYSVTGSMPFNDDGKYVTLGSGNNATVSVPAGMTVAVIYGESGKNVLVDDAAISYSSSGSFQNGDFDIINGSMPLIRDLEGVTALHFHAINSSIIKVSFYRR